MIWPWKHRLTQIDKLNKEADERHRRAQKTVEEAKKSSEELRAEMEKNSWSELFIEAFRGRGAQM